MEAQGGEERAKYGNNLIKEYSKKLTKELGKSYSTTSLKYMRQFYIFTKSQPVVDQLSWSHYCVLMSIKDANEYNYYQSVCIRNNLSKRDLISRIKSKEYERLPEETRKKLKEENLNLETTDLLKNPIIIRNKKNKEYEKLSEKLLKQFILEDLDYFLKELGEGFMYVGNEYKIKIGNTYHYIDLLLFNVKYNSYVVIELKVTNFKAEYISQVQKYMSYIDKNIKEINNSSTVGIIICKKDNKYVIEYVSDSRIKRIEYICE